MDQLSEQLARRLLFVLHYGLSDIRNLALSAGQSQIADLADALEVLPGIINQGRESQAALASCALKTYQDKYPGRAFDYLAHVEKFDPPERF